MRSVCHVIGARKRESNGTEKESWDVGQDT